MITRSYLLPSLVLGSVSRRARLLVEESVMAGHGGMYIHLFFGLNIEYFECRGLSA